MKIAAIVVLSLVIIFIGVQVFSFVRQEHQLNAQFSTDQANLAKAQAEQANLEQENNYLQNPENLEKELRSQFNYKKPGETMVIIVPPAGSSTATTTP